MKRYGWQRPPIIIALVLSHQLEKYFWLSINTYGWQMFLRPQVLIILGLTIAAVLYTLRVEARANREMAAHPEAA